MLLRVAWRARASALSLRLAQQQLPHWSGKSILQLSDADLFAELGLEEQIQHALEPEYTMPSGAELVFEQTKALVSVDVNSKSFKVISVIRLGSTFPNGPLH